MGEGGELGPFCRMDTLAAVRVSLRSPCGPAVLSIHSEEYNPHLIFTFSYPSPRAAEPAAHVIRRAELGKPLSPWPC